MPPPRKSSTVMSMAKVATTTDATPGARSRAPDSPPSHTKFVDLATLTRRRSWVDSVYT